MFTNAKYLLLYLFLVSTGLISSCAGPQIFTTKPVEIIKPLDSYELAIQRDVAQMAYPGMTEIKDEMSVRLPENSYNFVNHGLRVQELMNAAPGEPGFYLTIEMNVHRGFRDGDTYLAESEGIARYYLQDTLVSISRDWNRLLSPTFAGSHIIFHWKRNSLMLLLATEDIQSCLNAQISLQELVDRNWVEGEERDESLGRIELNHLNEQQL
jgi:hypothetical protein